MANHLSDRVVIMLHRQVTLTASHKQALRSCLLATAERFIIYLILSEASRGRGKVLGVAGLIHLFAGMKRRAALLVAS